MENDYNKYTLQDLRGYAQKLGVKSPTSKTKQNLIIAIKQVENGEIKPYSSLRGRPKYQKLKVEKKCPNCTYASKEKQFITEFIIVTQKYLDKVQNILNKMEQQR